MFIEIFYENLHNTYDILQSSRVQSALMKFRNVLRNKHNIIIGLFIYSEIS